MNVATCHNMSECLRTYVALSEFTAWITGLQVQLWRCHCPSEHVTHMLEPLNDVLESNTSAENDSKRLKQCCFIPNILNWQMSACLRKLEMVKTFFYDTNKLHWRGNIWGWCCNQDVDQHYQVCVCRSAPPTQRTSERCSVLPSMTGRYWQEAPSNGQHFMEVRCLLMTRHPYIMPEYMLLSICQP